MQFRRYEIKREKGGYNYPIPSSNLGPCHDQYVDYDADSDDENFVQGLYEGRPFVPKNDEPKNGNSSFTPSSSSGCLQSTENGGVTLRMFEVMITVLERELHLVRTCRTIGDEAKAVTEACTETLSKGIRTNELTSKFFCGKS